MSEDEEDENPRAILCMRVTDHSSVTPEYQIDACKECGEPVWLAPSSQAAKKLHPKMEVLCQICGSYLIASKMAEGEKVRLGRMRGTDAEFKEITGKDLPERFRKIAEVD